MVQLHQVNLLRYLGIICRNSQDKTQKKMYFMKGTRADGWFLSSSLDNLNLKRFLVAVDGVAQCVGEAPSDISEYVEKVWQLENVQRCHVLLWTYPQIVLILLLIPI